MIPNGTTNYLSFLRSAGKGQSDMGNKEVNTPLVSVVMAAKNAENTIKEAIESILSQTIGDLELIVIDDGSEDSTKDILNDYQKSDSRLVLFSNKGEGVCDARNFGIEVARASLYAVMDSDDISLPNRLQRQYEQFQENEKLVLLGTNYHTFNDDLSNLIPVELPVENGTLKKSVLTIPTFGHPTIMARMDAVRKAGGYRKNFEGAEDHDLYLRLSKLGEFAVLPEFLFYYRTHPQQFSQRQKAKGLRASVASSYCFSCIQENKADPSDGGNPCEKIVVEFLEQVSETNKPMTKETMKLCVRAIQGLTEFPHFVPKIVAVRRTIFLKLFKTKQFKLSYNFWKSTRRRKWLAHKKFFQINL